MQGGQSHKRTTGRVEAIRRCSIWQLATVDDFRAIITNKQTHMNVCVRAIAVRNAIFVSKNSQLCAAVCAYLSTYAHTKVCVFKWAYKLHRVQLNGWMINWIFDSSPTMVEIFLLWPTTGERTQTVAVDLWSACLIRHKSLQWIVCARTRLHFALS